MNDWMLWLLTCIASLTLLISLLLSLLAFRLSKAAAATSQPVLLRQLELLDKVTTMVATKDVLAYQGVQAMQTRAAEYAEFDPSDEGQARREQELYDREMTDEDDAALYDAFG